MGHPQVAATSSRGRRLVSRFEIDTVEDIPVGQGRAYRVGGRTIAVFRQRDGSLFATDNACPHRGGPLADGIVGDGKVICPLHAWKLELRSGRCLGEDASVITHEVAVIENRIVVTLAE